MPSDDLCFALNLVRIPATDGTLYPVSALS
jgi:hypothetical protein